MTIEKAIEYLKWIRPQKPYSLDKKNVQTAIDMAIEALEHNHMICPHCLKAFYVSEVRFVIEEGDEN